MQHTNLFPKFRSEVSSFCDVKRRSNLLIKDCGDQRIYYAPFDYVNPEAKLFIVGITPGEVQMSNMLKEARRLVSCGYSDAEVVKKCKTVGSFSGPMRKNLVEMMDHIGLARYLGIQTTDMLFNSHSELANLTSCVRYPTFTVKNGIESNFNAEIKPKSELYRFAAPLTLEEIEQAPRALLLPLGPKVGNYLRNVLKGTAYEKNLLPELPHPSGANAERIAYFLDRKNRSELSIKTNPDKIDESKSEFRRILSSCL